VTHLTDDELVLHYYGEDGHDIVAAERHLRTCAQCTRARETLARTLNAVTPPALVDAPDDLPALRLALRDGAKRQFSPTRATIAFVWLLPLLYPVSLQVLFSSGRWAQGQVAGVPVVLLALIWACAGPFAAVLALNRIDSRGQRASRRLLVLGALMSAIGPSLFILVSRMGVSWYGALAVVSLLALVPWPRMPASTPRVLQVHRISALVLTLFVLAHVVNQALAFVSVPAYTAMRSVMRLASVQPASHALIVGAVLIQIVTGAALGMKHVRGGAFARNLQAVSGWCLAAFLLTHVFGPLLTSAAQTTATVAAAANQFDLLATPRSAAQLPFLLLGTASFLFHLGVYARLAALAYLAEASVRRLSYVGALAGATVVVAMGLALCGIHLKP
jgi:succinate dehydrogenase/fumarate reductase cytochrome b subunit